MATEATDTKPAEAKKDSDAPKEKETKKDSDKNEAKSNPKVGFFRNRKFAGEKFNAFKKSGERAPGFIPHIERWEGETVTVGYFATSNEKLLKQLKNTPHVEKITKKEYEESTTGKNAKRAL